MEAVLPSNPIDLFTDSAQQAALAESISPDSLKTPLYKHQRQALTFMIEREKGWALRKENGEIWTIEKDQMGQTVHINHVSGQRQRRPPKEFRGGLLTDAPGLGKTLSIIALVAYEKSQQINSVESTALVTATLLVVPKTRKSGVT